ncbi:MAG: nucleotide exchange factor GrpE [Bacilli bacterium]|nr:nucleotide exchange factor GrpE [Bacilli bacterium]
MEEKKTKTPETNEEEVKESKKDKLNKMKAEVDKANADMAYWKNMYYKAYADMENLRKDIEKDHRNALKYRAEGFIDELLPVLDGFHMALQNEPTDPVLKNYLIGFQYIYKNLVSVLENEGVTEFAPKAGEKFNPDHMQAIDTVECDQEPNTVVRVMTNGYKLHDHLVRPAMVVVAKAKEQKEETKEDVKIDA